MQTVNASMIDNQVNPKAIGAIARAEALSSEERKEIAKKAAATRWESHGTIVRADLQGRY